MFSHAQRHVLLRGRQLVQVFPTELTDLQRLVLRLLGLPERAYRPPV